MKGIPQGRYTKEFREEAVKLVIEEKLSWSEAGRSLSLPASTIGNWVKAYNSKLSIMPRTHKQRRLINSFKRASGSVKQQA